MAPSDAAWRSVLDTHIMNLTNHHTILNQLRLDGRIQSNSGPITEAQLRQMCSRVEQMLADMKNVMETTVNRPYTTSTNTNDGSAPTTAPAPQAADARHVRVFATPRASSTVPNKRGAARPTSNGSEHASNSFYYVDTKPTPVNFEASDGKAEANHTCTSSAAKDKRKSLGDDAAPTSTQAKRPRISGAFDSNAASPVIEYEDISAEVDARLQEREESKKRNRRRMRRRKRESLASIDLNANGTEEPSLTNRPKKKLKTTSLSDGGSAPEPVPQPSTANDTVPKAKSAPDPVPNISAKRRLTNGSDVVEIHTAGRHKRRKANND